MRIPDDIAAIFRGSHQLGVFLRLGTDDPVRLWLGVNDIPAQMQSIEAGSEIYYGGWRLQDVPDLEFVINGVADRADFTLSGIDPDTRALSNLDAVDVRGRDFHIGVTALDDHFQPVSPILPLVTGRASLITERMLPAGETEDRTISLTLSVGFGITTRGRQSQSLWSSAHHKADYPTDLFCDATARLERGVYPTWPRN